jgi:hypothetical protein
VRQASVDELRQQDEVGSVGVLTGVEEEKERRTSCLRGGFYRRMRDGAHEGMSGVERSCGWWLSCRWG